MPSLNVVLEYCSGYCLDHAEVPGYPLRTQRHVHTVLFAEQQVGVAMYVY